MRLQNTYHLILLLYRGRQLYNNYQKNTKFKFGFKI